MIKYILICLFLLVGCGSDGNVEDLKGVGYADVEYQYMTLCEWYKVRENGKSVEIMKCGGSYYKEIAKVKRRKSVELLK